MTMPADVEKSSCMTGHSPLDVRPRSEVGLELSKVNRHFEGRKTRCKQGRGGDDG